MNIKERLRHLSYISTKDRATGRTTRLIELAKAIGAIFITHSTDAAKIAERKHPGLVARSMDVNLQAYSGPFVFDHHAIEKMFDRAVSKIEELEEENAFLRRSMVVYIDNIDREVNKMREMLVTKYDHRS